MPYRAILLPIVFCAACSRLPDPYPPPAQRAPLTPAMAGPVGYFVDMSQADADNYLVRDFAGREAGTWRWALSHPEMRFYAPSSRVRFAMDFSLPERMFRETGPVTLTLRINGEVFDRQRYEKGGEQHYLHEVPPALVRANAINLIAIDPDPVWVSKADGGRLGFILARAGFTE